MPKVSIITACYNGEKFLLEFLNCILNQTVTDFELIICDDMSTDRSSEIIEQFRLKDKRIKLFRNKKNLGPAASRNHALKYAVGRYVAFCDVDDIWDKNKLSIQIDEMEINNASISMTNLHLIDQAGTLVGERIFKYDWCNLNTLRKRNFACCSSVVIDQHKVGKFQFPKIRKAEDYSLWLSLLELNQIAFYVVAKKLVFYRVHPHSESSNKLFAFIGHYLALEYTGLKFWPRIYNVAYYVIASLYRNLSEKISRAVLRIKKFGR